MGKCVGSLPPPPEPPEDEPDASAPPLEPEPELEPELFDPLDDPEPLDELLPPELVLPDPPLLLDPPLGPPPLPELDEAPHEAISPAITKPIDATAVRMVRVGTNPRSSPVGNRWKSEQGATRGDASAQRRRTR
jgi:hypothetical protein